MGKLLVIPVGAGRDENAARPLQAAAGALEAPTSIQREHLPRTDDVQCLRWVIFPRLCGYGDDVGDPRCALGATADLLQLWPPWRTTYAFQRAHWILIFPRYRAPNGSLPHLHKTIYSSYLDMDMAIGVLGATSFAPETRYRAARSAARHTARPRAPDAAFLTIKRNILPHVSRFAPHKRVWKCHRGARFIQILKQKIWEISNVPICTISIRTQDCCASPIYTLWG